MALIGRKSVLVLRALGLGDFLTGVPAIRAVARAHPGHDVVLACPAELEGLARLSGAVGRILPHRGIGPIPWEGPAPAVAVNFHGKGPQSHQSLQELHPHRLVAFACDQAGVTGPPWRDDEHEVTRWCRLVESAGWSADLSGLHLAVPTARPAVEGAVVVHPGAAFPARRWPASRFATVARWLDESGHPVVVTGGPDERALAEEVATAAGLRPDRVLAGELDLLALSALVASARLVISGDTGVAHLATAYRTPSVVLFGPVSPRLWGPPPSGPHTVVWHGRGGGDPWADTPDPALLEVTVDEVAQAARAHLT